MDVLNSFFENIKNKLTNPFFGTFLLVLLFQHWKLWYGVFHFDDTCTLDDKLLWVETYITTNISWESLAYDAVKALFKALRFF